MHQNILGIFMIFVIVLCSIHPVFAHTAKVVEDFKIDIGWKNEPPLVGQENFIEIAVSLAEEYDKRTYEMIFFTKMNSSEIESTIEHLSELEKTISTDIKLDGEKQFLELNEEPYIPGLYLAKYTPNTEGTPIVHIFGTIKNIEFELTSKIEKIKPDPDLMKKSVIPEWIRNNAKWYANGSISESDFLSGIEYMIKNDIIKISELAYHSSEQTGSKIPDWIRNNAKWWSEGIISDGDFVKGIEFLVEKRIIQV